MSRGTALAVSLLLLSSVTAGGTAGDESKRPSAGPFGGAAPARDAPGFDPSLPPPEPDGFLGVPTLRLRWPLSFRDRWHQGAYVDRDGGTGLGDYNCGAATVDGHLGNDIDIPDFVAMDEGQYVLAAADGIVSFTDDGYFDRESQLPPGLPTNEVVIEHPDGTVTSYIHLKKWSVLVRPGQRVYEGQPIGLIGSSGRSGGPHLHFDVRQGNQFYEPYAGPCRTGESLWRNQLGYAYDSPVRLNNRGVTTTVPSWSSILEKPPTVLHIQQSPGPPLVYHWVTLLAVQVGDVSRAILRDPSGDVWSDYTFTHPDSYLLSWWYWPDALPETGLQGTWEFEYLLNGLSQGTIALEYDTNPAQPPTASGRTVQIASGLAGGDLRAVTPDADLEDFRVTVPPAHGEVKLDGARDRWFSYVADSGYSGPDSFQFEAVDGLGQTGSATMQLDVSPSFASVLRLEGEDDYVSVPTDPSLDFVGQFATFTLEAWIRRGTGSAGRQAIFDRRNPGEGDKYGYHLFLLDDGRVRLGVGGGGLPTLVDGFTVVPLDTWVHVAATWDGIELRLYVDGVDQTVGPATVFLGPIQYLDVGELRIGGSFGVGESFRGEIAEARIWNVARTYEEIQAAAACPAGSPGLVGWWRLDGDVTDTSGTGNDGTAVAGASFLFDDAPIEFCPGDDTDGDTVLDAADNCPRTPNLGQADQDADGRGDACDPCALIAGGAADADRDGVGDACDLCPFVGDTEQNDADSDGSGDLCDPDPASASLAVPSSAITVTGARGAGAFSWNAAPDAATYETFRVTDAQLRDGFWGTCQNHRDPDDTDTSFDEDELPAGGEFFGYLVLGVAADGTPGQAGVDSDGRMRDLRGYDCVD